MKVVVAGGSGLAGSAIAKAFASNGSDVFPISKKNVNFLDATATADLLKKIGPSVVVVAAAKVGGISANSRLPVDFLEQNLSIQQNIFQAAHFAETPKLVFLGSSCIYPRDSLQPIKEEYLLTGPLEKSNSAYAIAKIAGIELVNSYRKQYGYNWISLMPTNLYGPGDNFNLEDSHVLPALIRRFIEAAELGKKNVVLWGSGKPRREFLHVDDFARAVVLATDQYRSELHLNIGTGDDLTVEALAVMVADAARFKGEIEWDMSKPDGTPRKVLDVSRIKSLGWQPQIDLQMGIESTIEWYKNANALGKVRK